MPNPIEFENIIADHFKKSNYEVENTPRSYDFGVDLFATRNGNKIAIQAKMYDVRKVNHEAVMILFAAQKLFNCEGSIIITSGNLTKEALGVAEKLGVTVWENWKPDMILKETSLTKDIDYFFQFLWDKYIIPLKGRVIKRDDGKENTIIEVNWDYIKRLTSNNKVQKLPIEIFRQVINHLYNYGEIERDRINQMFVKRASSGISLILSQNPYIELEKKPKMKLVLNRQMFYKLLENR